MTAASPALRSRKAPKSRDINCTFLILIKNVVEDVDNIFPSEVPWGMSGGAQKVNRRTNVE